MRRRQLSAALAMGVALLACMACSSSITGTATTAGAAAASTTARDTATGKAELLSPDQVASAARSAYQGASAVHVKGSLTDSGSTWTVDLQLNKDSGSGTIGNDGTDLPIIWVNGVFYLQFTDAVLQMSGLAPTSGAGAVLRNKWVSSDSAVVSDRLSGIKGMLTYNLVEDLVGKMGGETFTAAGSDTVNGVTVVAFTAVDGATVYLAASAPHYVMRLVGAPSDPGSLDFTEWNHPVAVTAPPASEIISGPGPSI